MPRRMVGLFAAVGAAMSALAALAHGDVVLVIIAAVAGVATGLAAYLALPPAPASAPATGLATYAATLPQVKKSGYVCANNDRSMFSDPTLVGQGRLESASEGSGPYVA
jgi:hypothetical protein